MKKPVAKKTAPPAQKKAPAKKADAAKSVRPAAKKVKAPVAAKPVNDISYNPNAFEKKWQEKWEADGLYGSVIDESKPKHYALTMLPYPSGDLHIGHWYAMIPPDSRARYMRMKGNNVLFPMGFDAFGLNAENAAIKDGIHPMKRTFANIERMRKQMRSMGTMFDWQREAVSADPSYYKWTEWFFIQLYKAGLAYRKMSPVDFCPNCNTRLALAILLECNLGQCLLQHGERLQFSAALLLAHQERRINQTFLSTQTSALQRLVSSLRRVSSIFNS